jgi:hypothetical protein
MAYPTVTFQNQLSIPVVIYDSFNNEDQAENLANYFGTLTQVGTTVAPNSNVTLQPIHGPLSVYIIYDTNGNPVKRVYTLGSADQSFQVTPADAAVIASTNDFVSFVKNSPSDAVASAFQALIKDGKATPTQINTFFQNTTNYKNCTYISYMLVLTTLARTPASSTQSIPDKSYSLSALCSYLGVTWPSELPDIAVTNFSCSNNNDVVRLGGTVDLSKVAFADGVMVNVLSILPQSTVRVAIIFNYSASLAFLNTTLEFFLNDISIPVGGGTSINIDKPTIILTVAPIFKFVVFEVKATIPFSLFGSPTINADVAMTIDNVEAEIGVVLEEKNATLFTPPILKGVHFDSVGVGMGLFFKPPGYAVGVQGAFHIGDAGSVALDDDTFVVVCNLEGDVPNPVYISFYVPKMDLSEIITMFTNSSANIGFPISISGLSFKWIENPMEPVTLPDGSLAAMAYGFSGNLDFFGLSFYGDAEIDLNNGVNGTITMSPFTLGPLSLTGDGKGVTIKVDSQGNPIKNNFIPKTAADKEAVRNATNKQLVPPGGPEMTISTSGSPYFTLGANLKFLEFNDSISSTVDNQGITFDISLLTTRMHCVLKDYQNFSGAFSFGPDFTVPLPSIAGFNLGSIHFQATINGALGVAVSPNEIDFSFSGGFSLFGLSPSVGPVNLDINITSITQVFDAIEQWIIDNAESLFGGLFADAKAWVNAVNTSLIQPLENDAAHIVQGLAIAYGKTAQEVGVLLNGTNYAINDVAAALKNTFSAPAGVVAGALVSAYNATQAEVAVALNAAGYAASEIGDALISVFDATESEVATAFSTIGLSAVAAASAIQSVFSATPDVVNTVLQQAGYAESEIENAFNTIGGAFADFAQSTWSTITHWDKW